MFDRLSLGRGTAAQRRTSMEAKITHVALVVSDQPRAVEFYTEKVGFEVKADFSPKGGSRYVTVGPKGQDLEIMLWEMGGATDPSQKELSKNWAPGKAPPIVLRVTDCRGIHKELSARGVKFHQEPFDHPWGTSATFVDPDGNLFSMSQPPGSAPKK
jgi:predicted enzyme related to lactoylglutathione lyase